MVAKNLRTCVLVLGSHRSGTSALTRLINLAGAQIGDNLLEAAPSNPKGHWESIELFTMQQKVLEGLGMGWESPWNIPGNWFNSTSASHFRQDLMDFIQGRFAASQLFVIKDPRSCRLAPVWLDAFQRLGIRPAVVIALRNPHEVANSLKIRNRMEFAWGYAMWLRYMIDAERHTRQVNRCLIRYEDVLGYWKVLLTKLGEGLAIEWKPARESAQEAEMFIDRGLRHHAVKDSDMRSRLFPHSVNAAHRALTQIGTRSSIRRLDGIHQAMKASETRMGLELPHAVTDTRQYGPSGRYSEFLASVDRGYRAVSAPTRW